MLYLLEGSFQGDGHRVERLAQGADLVLDAGGYPLVEVTRGQVLGGQVQAADAPGYQDRGEVPREPRDEERQGASEKRQPLDRVQRRAHVLDVALRVVLDEDNRPGLGFILAFDVHVYRIGVSCPLLTLVDARLDRFLAVSRPPGLLEGALHQPDGPVVQVSPWYLIASLIDYAPLQPVRACERADALLVEGFAPLPQPLYLLFELVPDLLEGGLARPVERLKEDGVHDLVGRHRGQGGYEHEERREPDAHAQARLELTSRREQLPGLLPGVRGMVRFRRFLLSGKHIRHPARCG